MTENVREIPFATSEGAQTTLSGYGPGPVLVVNVASKCGLTPQYEQLVALQHAYAERGLTVVGFPCNQFLGQEPGSMEQILDYCATEWGVNFPINAKIAVNGSHAAPLFKALTKAEDLDGKAGRVKWNFEKFLVGSDGSVTRFRPRTVPDDPSIISAIESALS